MYNELKKEFTMPQLFDYTEEECTYEEYQSLMPTWYR
jgi:hypothetical protein